MVAFDVETTGLDPDREELIEIAGVKFTFEKKDGKLVTREISQYGSLVKPGKLIPEDATRVNNITNQMVENAPELKPVLSAFLRFCGLSTVLVAHNASFDASFLGKAIRKQGLVMPQNPIIDSLKLLRKIMPEYASHKLGEIARKLGDQTGMTPSKGELHRATYDCQILKEVLCVCLRKRYQDKDLAMDQALKAFESIHGQPLNFAQFS